MVLAESTVSMYVHMQSTNYVLKVASKCVCVCVCACVGDRGWNESRK